MKNYYRSCKAYSLLFVFSLCSHSLSAKEKPANNYHKNFCPFELHGLQVSLDSTPVITIPAAEITYYSAICGGKITHEHHTKIEEKGICWSFTSGKEYKNIKNRKKHISAGSGAADFTCQLIDLNPGTTYYAKAYFKNKKEIFWGNEVIIQTNKAQIGQVMKGGVIAYILQPGNFGYQANAQHGLIASSETKNSFSKWESRPISKPVDGTRYELGTGAENTQLIIIDHGFTGYYAAKICIDYNSGGYTDWFLPSKDELYRIYLNRASIGFFVKDWYWSSTEKHRKAYALNFRDGTGVFQEADKSSKHWVRPVRYF